MDYDMPIFGDKNWTEMGVLVCHHLCNVHQSINDVLHIVTPSYSSYLCIDEG